MKKNKLTPKEKAKELVNIFSLGAWGKENAIKCVDLFIEQLSYTLFNEGLKDVHVAVSSPKKIFIDVINPEIKYWKEVKKEIEQL